MNDAKKLNKEQLEAVTHKTGPLLIIAGAGTGKTTVITERVKHLVSTNVAQTSEILCLTFTEKAASEMEARIDEALPLGYTQMWVLTFHGFCDRVLRESALHIGLDPNYRLMSTAESLDLLRANLFELGLDYFRPLGNPTKFLFGLHQHFSRLQDEEVTPDTYIEWAESEVKSAAKGEEDDKLNAKKWLELANAYKKYDEIKTVNSVMDFGDLIAKTLLLFRERPNILKEYQVRFPYILVDEYQDTNYAQNELTKLLAGKKGNITVVGDDDQSIYKFRGAAVSNMLSFRRSFPETKVVTLTRNYRSKQRILDVAHELVSHNNPDRLEVIEGINKQLVAEREGTAVIDVMVAQTGDEEAESIAEKIIELTKNEYTFGDCAILVRANNHAELIVRALTHAGIPHQFLGPGKLFEQEEIAVLISYLKVVTDITDSQALYHLISSEFFDISPVVIAQLLSFSKKESRSLFESIDHINSEEVEEIEKLHTTKKLITDDLALVPRSNAGTLLYGFLDKSGILAKIISDETPHGVSVAQNIAKFFNKLKVYENNSVSGSVQSTIAWIELQMELGESPMATEIDWSEEDAVRIMTIHSAKGLEFPVVFLVNLVSLRFPSTSRSEQIPIPDEFVRETLPTGDFHLQEERRLFYVGLTRARDHLYLTAGKIYGDAKREKKLSPFIDETLGQLVHTTKNTKKELIQKSPQAPQKDIPDQPKFQIDYLSFSQIETFKICPLHYKLHYILKIPTAPSAAQSFGNTFHAVMKSFYESIDAGVPPTKKLLDELLETNWIREGYMSEVHMKEMHDRAQDYLHYFLNHYYDASTKTKGVEVPFIIKLDGFKVGGIIDRVDEKDGTLHILDYKTGANKMSQKDADKSLQLSIYALAATKIFDAPFGYSPEKIKLSLMYLEDPEVVTTHRTQKQLDEAVKEICEWKEKIEESDFSCSGNFLCQNCEYRRFCNSSSSTE